MIQNDFSESKTEADAVPSQDKSCIQSFLAISCFSANYPNYKTYVLYSLLLCTHPNKMPVLCYLSQTISWLQRSCIPHSLSYSEAQGYLFVSPPITRQLWVCRQLLGQVLEQGNLTPPHSEVNVLGLGSVFKLTKSDSEPWIFLSTQLPTGQMNDRDFYLPQSWRHFIIQ